MLKQFFRVFSSSSVASTIDHNRLPFIRLSRPAVAVGPWHVRRDPLKSILDGKVALSDQEVTDLSAHFQPRSGTKTLFIDMRDLNPDQQKKAVVVADAQFPTELIHMQFAHLNYTLGPDNAIMSIALLRKMMVSNLKLGVDECIQAGYSFEEAHDNRQHLNPQTG